MFIFKKKLSESPVLIFNSLFSHFNLIFLRLRNVKRARNKRTVRPIGLNNLTSYAKQNLYYLRDLCSLYSLSIQFWTRFTRFFAFKQYQKSFDKRIGGSIGLQAILGRIGIIRMLCAHGFILNSLSDHFDLVFLHSRINFNSIYFQFIYYVEREIGEHSIRNLAATFSLNSIN